MNQQQRMKLLESQLRAYTAGSVELINEQWIFFDKETDEAVLLDEFIQEEVEVYRLGRWKKGILSEPGKISMRENTDFLRNNDLVRIRKHLVYTLERLLEGINDEAFIQFITTLNSLEFSIYDCLYCYNHLSFLEDSNRKSGVNFLVFDNQEHICNVQHHFCYYEKTNDRFEFTLNTGKRLVIEKIMT